jgi:hypothetical protein
VAVVVEVAVDAASPDDFTDVEDHLVVVVVVAAAAVVSSLPPQENRVLTRRVRRQKNPQRTKPPAYSIRTELN